MTLPDDRTADAAGRARPADARVTQQDQGEVNTQPGPTDQGGSGGMATREQQAREAGEE